ncbi:MAG TPA: inosine monophosphate cyclohydrolase [Clostridiales bacterium]|nr:inosine monophosphate cyclohydrolase [Clostridiales bacterium]
MFKDNAVANLSRLSQNTYPGRGIILGVTPDDRKFVQVYWIMGRSENSRNRIFVQEEGEVCTRAFDPSKVKDPSLIIYSPVRSYGDFHVVSNGDQTDTVVEALRRGRTFESALSGRTFEPDSPNYTPRITGIMEVGGMDGYKLAIIKPGESGPETCLRAFYHYDSVIPGFGHCIHTYTGDGDPLPAFDGEPYLLPMPAKTEETLHLYWEALNPENRISLLVKQIHRETGVSTISIINRLG